MPTGSSSFLTVHSYASHQPRLLMIVVIYSFTGSCEWMTRPCGWNPLQPCCFWIVTAGAGRRFTSCSLPLPTVTPEARRGCKSWNMLCVPPPYRWNMFQNVSLAFNKNPLLKKALDVFRYVFTLFLQISDILNLLKHHYSQIVQHYTFGMSSFEISSAPLS